MGEDILASAIASVPAGQWGVGVSGGADSVALLLLLSARTDLGLHVIHLDHQTRGIESDADSQFVAALAERLRLPRTITKRELLEAEVPRLPPNPSARYRALRLELFRRVAAAERLQGVLLAHHADDQAETVLHRLLRGASAAGLAGMSPQTHIGGLLLLRPLLRVPAASLREHLRSIGQPWREDSSNTCAKYLRNRLRLIIAANPPLRQSLRVLGDACATLREWAEGTAPRLAEQFATQELAQLPQVMARQSARRWLLDRGAPAGDVTEQAIDHLIEMSADAASAPRVDFAGGVRVRRRTGIISAAPARSP